MIRFGLIGCGRWGKIYVKTISSLSDLCRLTVLGSSRQENAALVESDVAIENEWHRAIDPSRVDAVIISTPPETHADLTRLAVQQGLPCIVEKPLTLSLREAIELSEDVNKTSVPVLINHIQLFQPAYQLLREMLEQRVETPEYIMSEGGSWGPFRAQTPALWDWVPHDLSLCLDLMKSEPVGIQSIGSGLNPQHPDQWNIRLCFSEGGEAWIQTGRLMPQRRRELLVATQKHTYWIKTETTSQVLVREGGMSNRYKNPGVGAPGEWKSFESQTRETPMQQMIRYFIQGIRGGDQGYFGLGRGVQTVKILEQIEHEQLHRR